MTRPLTLLATLLPLVVACTRAGSSAGTTPPPTADVALDDARGGRIYDRWTSALEDGTFAPDSEQTVGVADGHGGPSGDGTLRFADGRVFLNDVGHDYRLKNLFGWDLRGASGIFGPAQMNKSYVLGTDLLTWEGSISDIARRLDRGDDVVPAFGDVLAPRDIEALAAFIVRVRDHVLPRPEDVFTLTSPAQSYYTLREGGDAGRGRLLFADRCAGCHGIDGTALLFDDGVFSLGTHARQKAYEDWLKILNGQPGTPMGRQVRGDVTQMVTELRDLFAALCDRDAFPPGAASGSDVPDGDPRCGAYLR